MRRDWLWLLALMIFGLIPRLYTLEHTTVASRDCVNFIQLGLNLDDSGGKKYGDSDNQPFPRIKALRDAEHPPATRWHFSEWLISQRGRRRSGRTLGCKLDNSSVSLLAAGWLCPSISLGKNSFNRITGLIAAALATALPTLAEITADALSDGLFLAINVTALACFQRGLLTYRWYWWLGAGVFGGAAYLVRPEGGVVHHRRELDAGPLSPLRHREEWKRALIALMILHRGFRRGRGAVHRHHRQAHEQAEWEQLLGQPRAERAPLFAAFILHTDASRVVTGTKLAISEPLRAANYGIGILGLLGAISLRKEPCRRIPTGAGGLRLSPPRLSRLYRRLRLSQACPHNRHHHLRVRCGISAMVGGATCGKHEKRFAGDRGADPARCELSVQLQTPPSEPRSPPRGRVVGREEPTRRRAIHRPVHLVGVLRGGDLIEASRRKIEGRSMQTIGFTC